jgi:hypothetical protein
MTTGAALSHAATPVRVKVFVSARGNGFMVDIASWIAEAATLTGRPAQVVTDGLPTDDGSLNLVVAPHEFFELHDASAADLKRAAAASVCVCTEQPGTPWFHLSVDACRRGLRTLDISGHGTEALLTLGIDARRLRLGSVPSMTAPRSPVGEREIDVLFMGGLDDRRGAALATMAPTLYRRHSELRLFRFEKPAVPGSPGLLFGADKYRLLGRAKVLLNVHRDRSMHHADPSHARPYFEWARMVEAIANGCVVVSEASDDHEPLQPGVHFIEASVDDMPAAVAGLLDDPERRERIASAARDAIGGDHSLAAQLGPLLDGLEAEVLPRVAAHVVAGRHRRGLWRYGASKVPPPVRLGAFRPYAPIQVHAKHLALADNRMLQRLDGAACLLAHGSTQHIERVETPAYPTAVPEVSVVVSLYNYADVVVDTLDSIVASEDVRFEVIVVEDHATDHSREVVRAYLHAHPEVPMVLLAKNANEGLAAARNTGFEAARAPLVMVMDADNMVYPTCLRRLADALAADPEAGAAYAILEDFGTQRNVRSALVWDVERLCRANYIDAQAMLRRSTWQQLGGYRNDDDHVFGWEDWDLWLRLARSGGHATLVPAILGRYRVQTASMITLTNLATDDSIAAIHARYPDLPWPV